MTPYLLEVPPDAGAVSWSAVFGNDRPVEIEVGFGKGLFLVRSSQTRPEVNFLGVEIARKLQFFVANRVAKRNLHNVRLVCTDARHFLSKQAPAGSVQTVHVYFPDPWWKQRHRKRRVFQPDFAAACEQVLQSGGRLRVATDVEAYFEIIQATTAKHTTLILEPPPAEKPAENDLDYLSNFERKARKVGKPVWRAVYRKP
ncbi:MAG: tRNA (guanosine(46)-N7)-methyltransferase TrmB [Planctomycetia bacterium]|nr:tRNA (guanosine(46)-N7)-methyltransferase TrmB [Planctomycetia bacterium]